MKHTLAFWISGLWLMIASSLHASPLQPVHWQYEVSYPSDSTAELVLTAQIEDSWHLYSQHQQGIALPLLLQLVPSSDYADSGHGFWQESPRYTEQHDALLNDTERYLTGTARFTRSLRRLSEKDFSLRLHLEGQACQEERCIPLEENLVIPVQGKTKTALPPASTPVPQQHVAASKKEEVDSTQILVATTPPLSTEQDSTDTPHSSSPATASTTYTSPSLGWFFLLAFLGGLLGLLTPCVFPMIPMTVSYFLKHGGKKQAVFYGISIVGIYVLVGLLLSALFGQDFANRISTHWLPNCLFTVLFVVFAFSLLGYFEITLPATWVNKSSGKGEKSGYIGTFFMALTLVLVSFSCTLPIAGAVALNAAGGGFLKPLVGMLGFSLAFTLPFTLFAFFPTWLHKLPKSGSWMNTLKVSLAFVELAFALKFLNVPDQTYHWGLLDREVYLAVWIVLFTLWGVYLLGGLRFPLDSEYPIQKSAWRFGTAVVVLSFVVYMLPGMWGAPLHALSGWLPPLSTQDFVAGTHPATATTAHTAGSFTQELNTVPGLNSLFDYDEAMAEGRRQSKAVFLDFTGHGCVNCRQVEQKVLMHPEIQQLLNENFIVATLYVDDKRIELPNHLQITDSLNQRITSLGAKNRYLQSSLYQQNSQPCYLIVNPTDGSVLSGPLFYETDPIAFRQKLLDF